MSFLQEFMKNKVKLKTLLCFIRTVCGVVQIRLTVTLQNNKTTPQHIFFSKFLLVQGSSDITFFQQSPTHFKQLRKPRHKHRHVKKLFKL